MDFKMDNERDLADTGIAMWNDECPELDTSGKAVTGRILRLSELILDRMNQTTHQFGVKYPTYAIVATLRASGDPFCMTPKALQATLLFTSGGMSNLLRRTEEQGYIRRTEDPSDRRGVLVQLTPAGRTLSEKAMPAQAQTELNMIRMFSDAERTLLADLLRRMLLVNSLPTR